MPVTNPGYLIHEIPIVAQQLGSGLYAMKVKAFKGTPAAVETAMNLWLDALPALATSQVIVLEMTQSQESNNNIAVLVRYAVKE